MIVWDLTMILGHLPVECAADAAASITGMIEAAEKNAVKDLKEDYAKLLVIARDLAAKHMRNNVCTFCGSAYNAKGTMEHNPGCQVKALEAYQ